MSFSPFTYSYALDPNVPLSDEQLRLYCERTGVDQRTLQSMALSTETLRVVMSKQMQSIPYENIAPLRQQTSPAVSLKFDDVFLKLVVQKMGGYCFELNYLLMVVLQTLGFKCVAPISARVRLRDPFNRAWIPPRTHFFLIATLERVDYIVDCGLGSPSLSAPLRFLLDVEQETGCDTRRITKTGMSFFHEYRIPGSTEWRDVCEFTGEEMFEIDRIVANWYCCNHPESHFRNRLTVARNTVDGRLAILNNELSIRRLADNTVEKVQIKTKEQLLAVLKVHFGLVFPPGTDIPCSGLVWN